MLDKNLNLGVQVYETEHAIITGKCRECDTQITECIDGRTIKLVCSGCGWTGRVMV